MSHLFDDLRFADLQTFLTVQRLGSVTGAARQMGLVPSQVSKSLVRLEQQLGQTLLLRSSHGVSLTEAGQRLLPKLDEVVARLHGLRRNDEPPSAQLSVAAPSFMNDAFLGTIALASPELRVRGLDLPPALVRAYASENFFDVTLSFGPARLPSTWSSTVIGDCRNALFGTPAIAKKLGAHAAHAISAASLIDVPFISPVFNTNGKFVPVDDGCPLRFGDRLAGHEAQTIALALELARQTDQVVFGPAFAARHYLKARSLVELRVKGWDVHEPLHLSCNIDRVKAKLQTNLIAALRVRHAEVEGAAAP